MFQADSFENKNPVKLPEPHHAPSRPHIETRQKKDIRLAKYQGGDAATRFVATTLRLTPFLKCSGL